MRQPNRTWLIVGGLAEAMTYSVFPVVVLLVLLYASPPPKADARRVQAMPPDAMCRRGERDVS